MSKLDSLKKIIQEARECSPEFDKKYHYWVEKRMKPPTHNWLFENLLSSLGEKRFAEFLQEQIGQEKEQEVKNE